MVANNPSCTFPRQWLGSVRLGDADDKLAADRDISAAKPTAATYKDEEVSFSRAE